jgi:predicted amidophosphoribosyltransferase
LSKTDPNHVSTPSYNHSDEICPDCGVYRELVTAEALLICPRCGDEIRAIMESDKPSYRDPPHESMYFAYKRINHFKEHLAHCQAKETTKIPQEIYDIILIEFKKEKKTNLATLTPSKVKKYLQKYDIWVITSIMRTSIRSFVT